MNLLQYILSETQNKRISKTDAISLIRQLQTQDLTEQPHLLHPLLHRNTSNFAEQRFSSTFTGREFFLTDHVVKEQRVLPGVAYLEMARAAVTQAAEISEEDQIEIRLKNVVWTRPIVLENRPVEVNIRLFPGDNEEITYEIYSNIKTDSLTNTHTESTLYSQGCVVLGVAKTIPPLDLKTLKDECSESSLSSTECYEFFKTMGFKYGPGLQGIERLYIGNGQVLAKLSLPASVSETKDQYVLHPSLMDAALQASIGLMINTGDLKLFLPFALQELQIISKCVTTMWALIRNSNVNTSNDKVRILDIDICDEQGNVCIRMKGFSSKALEGELGSMEPHLSKDTGAFGMLMFEPVWKEQAVPGEIQAPDYALHLLILCEPGDISPESLNIQINKVGRESRCLILQSNGKKIDERFQKYAIQVFEEIKNILNEKPKENILIQVIVFTESEKQLFSGLFGLLKTAQLENPKLITQLIEVASGENAKEIMEKIKVSGKSPKHNWIQYKDGKCYVADWSEVNVAKDETRIPWRDRGIYLITGGTGGLGLIFAKEIARRAKDVTLILTGRSKLSEDKHRKIEELEALGARVYYKQIDVTQMKMVTELFQSIQKDYGSLNGIIHGAGVIHDNYILKKTKEEFQEVLKPKVTGLVNLDQASKDLNLDFFVLFSSITGCLGNPGQADYSTANAFMDVYAEYRNTLVNTGQRHGRTLSINWPLWKEGGMRVDEETEKMMTQNTGMTAMRTETGVQALYQSLASGKSQIMVMEGKIARIKQKLLLKTSEIEQLKEVAVTSDSTTGLDLSSLLDNVHSVLKKAVSNLLKVKLEDIDVHTELNEYGFDSVSLTQFANKLNEEYKLELTPAIFFEHSTINSLAKYLTEKYQTVFALRFGVQTRVNVSNENAATADIVTGLDVSSMFDNVQSALIKAVSNLLKVKLEDIDVHTELNEYGFDSISLTQFANKLNEEYKLELTPAIFFEHSTISNLAKYMIEEYQAVFASQFAVQTRVNAQIDDYVKEAVENDLEESPSIQRQQHHRFVRTVKLSESKRDIIAPEPIAIIGMSGIFPMARDLNEFWNNLLEGRDCITEIPKDRWDWREYYGDPTKEANKTNIKWGGFIDGIDEFDPLFFGISPKEAELMDPQQRLLMNYVWKAIEDAGYSAQGLSGTKTGIFVGTATSGYNGLISRSNIPIEGYSSTGMVPSMGPNRMSYFLNIHGPSEPIETACSSSLIAIHRAVSAMENGSCEMAIVGGVNTIVTPELHISFNKAGMLSEDGRCKTFSDQANGYVRGEGVGMIFLKKLSAAERDGDHIYGVIRGTAENHGGRANSLTAPNPKAQAELLVTAYTKAGIDPRTVTYIEAHGTGTKLGDPIEINGLKTAFKELYQATGDPRVMNSHCGLGSVKTNIGHLELAAGVAGVIKVLLQLKYKTIVKSLHCDTINPFIDLKDSPFYIVRETQEWKALQDANGYELPRRAGVSSFGFGGANAHVVIEEYIPKVQERSQTTAQRPVIIVLSAKNEDRLKEQAQQLLNVIAKRQFAESDLADIAYTLQVGREPMEERLAFIANSINELEEKLKGFVEGQAGITDFYRGQVKRNQETLNVFSADEDLQKVIDAWVSKGKYGKILDLWVKGLNFVWNKLYSETRPRRISLPTYPFARERYWVPVRDRVSGIPVEANGHSSLPTTIHPLLHQNTSNLAEQRFSSVFTGQEFFLTDCEAKDRRVLPEVVYLEMARVAMEEALVVLEEGQTEIRLKNIKWIRPMVIEGKPVQVNIGLYPGENEEVAYEIYGELETDTRTDTLTEPIVYCQGNAVLSVVKKIPPLDLKTLQARCNISCLSSKECYEYFMAKGLKFSPEYQGIEKVYVGKDQVLAKLSLPESISQTKDQFVLHPSLMDSALQVSIYFMMSSGESISYGNNNHLKSFSLSTMQELEIFGKCTYAMWALVRYNDASKMEERTKIFDIDLCNEQGDIQVRITGMAIQENVETVEKSMLNSFAEGPESFPLMTFEEVWQEQALSKTDLVNIKYLVCFVSDLKNQQVITGALQTIDQQTKVIFITQSTGYYKHSKEHYSISRIDRNNYEEVFKSIQKDYVDIDAMIYLWALEDSSCIQDYTCIVYILQAIASTKLKLGRFLLMSQFENAMERCYIESWIGFERSLGLILPNTQVAVICQEAETKNRKIDMKDLFLQLWTEMQASKVESVLYQGGKRHVCKIRPTTIQPGESLLKPGGTYLITGGCGGLGLLFAEHLAKTQHANLILTGRSSIDAAKKQKIKALEDLGSRVLYVQADVCDLISMKEGLKQARESFGRIFGVIHAAGIESIQNILEKDIQSFQKVLDPKIKGTLMLDEILREEQLDFICYFSSSSAILGDFGSCDYAIGNRFLMAFAHLRNQEQRPGKAVVINWPLWKEGGMGFSDDNNIKMYLKSSGQRFLETEEGIAVFEKLLSQKNTQHLVIVGKPSRAHGFLGIVHNQSFEAVPIISNSSDMGKRAEMKGLSLEQCLEQDIKEHISKLLKISLEKLDRDENLADFGFDSISLAAFANLLTNHYKKIEIMPALFFEFSTIAKLTQYFLTKHQETIREFYRANLIGEISPPPVDIVSLPQPLKSKKSRFKIRNASSSIMEPIAIIGMSGIFPQAKDMDEFWRNLVDGKDCITEIPKDRWDWREYCNDLNKDLSNNGIKWGGFIDGVSEFDPLFFGISPREAELMDPQQRLLMMYVWKAIEDAGMTPTVLAQKLTGVFIAAGPGDYMDLVPASPDNPLFEMAVIPSMIPNRISYALNLRGPSEYCDTACSSTLVAIHRAIQSIHNHECEQAIIGAVNLLLSPKGFIAADAMGLLSPNGQAKSFQVDANGFVRSEGVGAIVIKPLQKAIEDRDNIYAVIKGTGVAHGGKGLSLTAPNPTGMKEAILQAYRATTIDPRTVTYIEAHGIASPMADSIEIEALISGYREVAASYTANSESGYTCYISSLKPCIGHGEMFSGMAALFKVVMAMRHQLIPGIPRISTLNEYLSLAGGPFQINSENHSWEALTDAYGKILPRRAGINSYGIGGINAHLVLEEYMPTPEESPQDSSPSGHYIIVFSAKNSNRLEAVVRQALAFIEQKPEISLPDLAYTLQVGREAMEHRMAIVVKNWEELIQGLKEYLKENKELDYSIPIFTGVLGTEQSVTKTLLSGKVEESVLQALLDENDPKKIALFWTQGGKIPWESFYKEKKVRRISLPTYPFEKRSYWIKSKPSSKLNAGHCRSLKDNEGSVKTEFLDFKDRIFYIVSCVLGINPKELEINKPLQYYGLDSILLLQLLKQLQNEVDPTFDLARLLECKTIQDIIDIIPWQNEEKPVMRREQTRITVTAVRNQFPELIHLNQISQGRPVFWFHAGLGGVEIYPPLAQKCRRPFYGIQARGWMTKRTPLQGIAAMAAYYIHIIQSVQPEGPYDLGGYSLGGVLAYEVTRQLQELGQTIATIVMLDSPAVWRDGAMPRQTSILQGINIALMASIIQEPEKIAQTLIHRRDVDFNIEDEILFKQLVTLARKRGLTKSEELLYSMIESTIRLQRAYQIEQLSVLPLVDPQGVTCYYFRAKRGLLYGELEPYFSATEEPFLFDRTNYWEEWEKQIPNIHIIDVDASNHMVMLSEPKVYETIFEFCERLYSEEKLSAEFLKSFKRKALKIHGSKVINSSGAKRN